MIHNSLKHFFRTNSVNNQLLSYSETWRWKTKKQHVYISQRHQQELSAVFLDVPVLDSVGLLSRLCLLLRILHTDGRRHHAYGQRAGVCLCDLLYVYVFSIVESLEMLKGIFFQYWVLCRNKCRTAMCVCVCYYE